MELLVVVLNGTIGSDITLSVNTSDGSADGTYVRFLFMHTL